LRLSHPAVLGELREIRGQVDRWARRHGLPEERLIDLQLAVGEAVSNGMEHAYPNGPSSAATVEVELVLRRTRAGPLVAVRVTDHGRWRLASADPGYRGWGMALIESLSVDLRVLRSPDGTQVRFEMPIGSDACRDRG
jgi:anti-sigma regulatory factor (Ser/Thr protein kinase)